MSEAVVAMLPIVQLVEAQERGVLAQGTQCLRCCGAVNALQCVVRGTRVLAHTERQHALQHDSSTRCIATLCCNCARVCKHTLHCDD
jgi:hypothetical protein